MESFFSDIGTFDCGVLIVDARHKPTADDIRMAEYFKNSGHNYAVVANKLDKLKKSEIEPNLQTIRLDLELPAECEIIPFSAEKGTGKEDLVRRILTVVKE
jgi:GTP-binding protein